MLATEYLKLEHRRIERLLQVVGHLCHARQAEKQPTPAVQTQLIEWISGFADGLHRHKEELLLFPALERAGIPHRQGPIGVMLLEHEQGRELLRQMQQAQQAGNTAAFVAAAAGYSELLTAHIFKEDNILYRMGDMHLSIGQQQQILAACQEYDGAHLSELAHFEAMLTALEAEIGA